MANSFKALTLALFLCLGGTAHAFYVDASPPPAWSPGGGPGGGVTGTKVGVNSSFSTGGYKGTAGLRVSGGDVKLPFATRYAPNVAKVAGAVIFANPYLRSAAAIATWLGIAGLVYDATSGLWTKPDEEGEFLPSDGYSYYVKSSKLGYYPSRFAACNAAHDVYESRLVNGFQISSISVSGSSCNLVFERVPPLSGYINTDRFSYDILKVPSDCPSGWYVTPAGCVQTPPVKTIESEEEFLDRLAPHPMPEEVPKHIPKPLPVELPEISPVFVPTGDPILNPKYNPQAEPTPENQPWIQPGVRVQPSPTPDQPWRVDLQPQNRPKSDSTPLPDVQPDGGSNPLGAEPANPGLCDQYPDILACAKLEEPEDPGPLKTIDIGGDFEILGGFAGSKVCPSFPTIDMLPGLSWQPFCDQLARIRPLVLAFAWLSAVMIILKYGRK